MKVKFLGMIDYLLVLSVAVLCAFGIVFIYSSGYNSEGILVSKEYLKQIIWLAVGFSILVILTIFDYRKLKRYSPHFFIALCLVLVYTRLFGRLVSGARSWIGIGGLGIQPSELGKIIFILFLAWYLERTATVPAHKRFLYALFALLIPMGLILIQPDLGTASVYFPIFLCMCLMADIPIRYLALVLMTGICTIFFTVLPIWHSLIWLHDSRHTPLAIISLLSDIKLRILVISVFLIITIIGMLGLMLFKKRYFYWIAYVFSIITVALVFSMAAGKVLKEYQVQRLIIFIDPSSDPLESGWNLEQSKIAIGSGGLFGRGFRQGTQSHYRYLPKQSTDFIFSILAEESGFIGCLVVFMAFIVIFLRIIHIMRSTTNKYGYFIAAGTLGMFFFHFIVNVGMDMGIMPITGIPLPFLSYGGSSMLSNMVAIGLLLSINVRKLDFNENVL